MPRSRRSATRSEGPQSPPKPRQDARAAVTTNASIAEQRQAAAAPSKLKKSLRSLPAVQEEENATTTLRDNSSASDSEQDLDSISLNGSDTTDDLEERLAAFDQELILDNILSLYQDALKIVTLFNPKSISKTIEEVKSDQTTIGRRYKQYRSRFRASLQPFRIGEEFIPTNLILRKLIGACGPLPPDASPDELLYMANLALVACDVIVDNDESKFDLLANGFPGNQILGVFGSAESVTGNNTSPLIEAIINLAISLRTQFFISKATEHQKSTSFDPDDLLQQAFYDDNGQVLGFEDQDDDLVDKVAGEYNKRIEQIRSCFSKSSKTPINLKKLRTQFPSNDFLNHLVSWLNYRQNELATMVDLAGGADTISDLLLELSTKGKEKVSPAVANQSSRDNHSTLQGPDRTSSAQMSNRIQQLKRIKARRQAQTAPDSDEAEQDETRNPNQEIPQSPTDQDTRNGDIQTAFADEDSPPPPTQVSVVPSRNNAVILAVMQRQTDQGNKENAGLRESNRRFTDKQKGAKRVEWDGGLNDDDEDEDDDFVVDTRQSKRPRIDRPAVTIVPNSNRTNVHGVRDMDSEDEDDPALDEDRNSRQYLPPPSTQPPASRSPLQEVERQSSLRLPSSSAPARGGSQQQSSSASNFPMASQVAMVNHQAKEAVRQAQVFSAPQHAPKIQVRRAWTAAETERLIDLIAMHGAAWSAILKTDADSPEGPELEGRGQVALKDKARNIKVDFLKASQPLPTGFEYVKIKASDVAKLESMGRRAHGAPTRNNPQNRQDEDEDEDEDM